MFLSSSNRFVFIFVIVNEILNKTFSAPTATIFNPEILEIKDRTSSAQKLNHNNWNSWISYLYPTDAAGVESSWLLDESKSKLSKDLTDVLDRLSITLGRASGSSDLPRRYEDIVNGKLKQEVDRKLAEQSILDDNTIPLDVLGQYLTESSLTVEDLSKNLQRLHLLRSLYKTGDKKSKASINELLSRLLDESSSDDSASGAGNTGLQEINNKPEVNYQPSDSNVYGLTILNYILNKLQTESLDDIYADHHGPQSVAKLSVNPAFDDNNKYSEDPEGFLGQEGGYGIPKNDDHLRVFSRHKSSLPIDGMVSWRKRYLEENRQEEEQRRRKPRLRTVFRWG